ncbi:MAG TPA: transposase [Vicinamibacterales bacterium]|nr:transposase [Vicinamibacterales bacterium]
MPRTRRVSPDNSIHHVLNRGNRRQPIFHKAADYAAFMNILGETLDKVPMRILAMTLMPNHFHLVLWTSRGSDLSAYMQCSMNVHVRRHHQHYGTTGHGHLYQGRFKNFLIQSDVHLYNVLRYVEGNAARAGLVTDARQWRWSSLTQPFTPDGHAYLSEWPVPRPDNWADLVNDGLPQDELRLLQSSVKKGAPYGDPEWVRSTVSLYGLESTVRTAGRKRKARKASALESEEDKSW